VKTDVDFILFAVKQAKEAETFGFSRNHCSRNLKTALDHHWQRKTLRLGQKARIPRSKAALNLPLRECVVEHVVPKMAIVNRLMDMEPLTTTAITELLSSRFMVMLVTHEEHARLNASGLRSSMPADWDGSDIFARYAAAGIEPASTSIANDRNA
jgi:hypothetical protein